jgi:hypothetical protein
MFKESYNQKEIAELMRNAPTSGTIEVRFKDPKRSGTITLRDYYHEVNGSREYRPFIDARGNTRVVKYQKKKVLNMANENDRLEYAHLKDHPIYVAGPKPLLQLYNFDEEATSYVETKDASAKANAIISKLSGEKLRNLARVVQIRTRLGSSDIVLKRALYEFAESKTEKGIGAFEIIEQIESPDYETKTLLYNALDSKLVEVRNGRYMFNQVGLGTTFDVSLQFLIDNPDIESELKKKLDFKDIK